jgi:hypothetical protein
MAMSKDDLRLLGYGLLNAFLMAAVLVPILIHDITFPKPIAEVILGGVAVAVFLLSKYMERRRKRRP